VKIPFRHEGFAGQVIVSADKTVDPATLGAHDGAAGLANCRAVVEFDGFGYEQLFGWVQLVRSTDNTFQGRQFEMDPFDPFRLYDRAPTPYCWYGILPTLFDAPSRDDRVRLDWLAHSFLAVSPRGGNRRVVTPLLGFSWGFQVADDGSTSLDPVMSLAPMDWDLHLSYLRASYPEWSFLQMPKSTGEV